MVLDGLQCLQEDVKVSMELIWELLQNRGDVVNGGGSGDNMTFRILDKLKLVKGFENKIKERGTAVIIMGSL